MTSSFASLKAARANRQKPLASRDRHAVPSPDVREEPIDPAEAIPMNTTPIDTEPNPPQKNNQLPETIELEPAALIERSTATGEPSVPVKGLPRYADLPSDKLEIRIARTTGRGLNVKSGSSIKKGESIIKTQPIASALSSSRLSSRCSRCWLDERELSVAQGKMHEYESRVGAVQLSGKQKEEEEEKGLKRCTGCKVVRYCSTDCQTADWPSHAQECRALKRLRRVTRKNKQRTRIQPQTPAQAEETRLLKAMTGEDDEEGGVPGWIPPDEVRLLGKLVWGRRKAREKGGPQAEGEYWAPIAEMQSHRSNLDTPQREPFARLALRLNQYLSSAEPLKEGEKEEELIPVDMSNYGFRDVPEVLDLCTAFGSNSFTLASSSLEPIGTAVSPLLSFLNHSCEPNAVVVFPNGGAANEGKGMELVALRDIDSEEEVSTCYVDVASPYHMRQKELQETYHFDCRCSLCTITQAGKVDPRWALRHPACGGPVQMPEIDATLMRPDLSLKTDASVRCETCQESYTVDVERLNNLIEFSEQLLQEDAHGLLGDFHASKVPSITDALSEYFLPSSYPFLPLLRLRSLLASRPTPTMPGQPMAETVKDLFDAIESQAMVWKGMKAVYPTGHPSLGLALTELGKLLNLDAEAEAGADQTAPKPTSTSSEVGAQRQLPVHASDRLGLARETLIMALEQLKIGFGTTGGLVGSEVEGVLEGLQKEMQFKGLIA
ncbi:hypothetical protein HD553DRAFT_326416 [Filobasidium floriforme]|uniref:uncharacterized protein n=1 Tax=Filobasidium floriforme TaxID=5210 RepID=UPI001E8CAE06|nr:uncharacterized protein HD553DRAFT_326416 [Filobasidium floriforme]KAH8079697.1 hypothetical protein HD553DRAFT_326416 [Filobasidium floriforme]